MSGKTESDRAIANKAIDNKGIPNKAIDNKGIPNKAIDNKGIPNKAIDNKGIPNNGPSNAVNSKRTTQQVPGIKPKLHKVKGVYLDNPAAIEDVKKRGNMLAGGMQKGSRNDRNYLTSTPDGRLGFTENPSPEDPFRWEKLKDIIRSGNVAICGISESDSFEVKEVTTDAVNNKRKTEHAIRSLRALDASHVGGITLVQDSLQRKNEFIGTDNPTDLIYYARVPGTGLSTQGRNSLAHEFFGHYWLALKGVPFGHRDNLTAAHNVLDPLGYVYVGSVDNYIDTFVASKVDVEKSFTDETTEKSFKLKSPTQRVGWTYYRNSFEWIEKNGRQKLIQSEKLGQFIADLRMNWEILSRQYLILKVNKGPFSKITIEYSRATLQRLLRWFGSLATPQQKLFLKFLQQVIQNPTRSSDMARDFIIETTIMENLTAKPTQQPSISKNPKGKPTGK